VALLEAALRVGPSVSTICEHIQRHEGQAGVRRILGVLGLAKKHGRRSSRMPPQRRSNSAFRRIAFSVAIWIAGRRSR
jgi:hypothetical protein